MKNLLIGVILTSSLVVSGDLEKCSHAVIMANKFDKLFVEANMNYNKFYGDKTARDIFSAKKDFYLKMNGIWKNEAEKDCKGIVPDIFYKSFFKY